MGLLDRTIDVQERGRPLLLGSGPLTLVLNISTLRRDAQVEHREA
jgi:hypothetical protein